MSTELSSRRTASFFGKLVGEERPLWATLAITLLLAILPIVAALLDGILSSFFTQGHWQAIYIPAAVILYILVVGPILTRMEDRVINTFRPLVSVDDGAFEQMIIQASRANPIVEAAAFGAGTVFGLWVGVTGVEGSGAFWLDLWVVLTGSLMFGFLAWAIYAAIASTRLTSALHRQPLKIDIFDTKPFEPIGRQSLAVALVFVGGILLSLIFGIGSLDVFAWQNWIVYLLLAAVIILVFFLNMRDTHRVLAAAKAKELDAVERNILQACRLLMERIADAESTGSLGPEINALVAYQDRVRAARTWPYDTAMLRTLFFSLIIPAAVELGKLIFGALFR